MGLFNAANQWFGALLFLPGVLGQAALPILSEHSRHGDRARLRTILAFYVRLSGLVVLPLVLCGAIASPYVMAWYGPAFREAWPTLIVILVTAGLLAVLNPVGQVIAALGRMWAGTLMNLGWAASFLLLTFLLVPWGALGLAWARLTAYLLHAVWTLAFARVLLARDWRAS
jgi:O-antigen/teichoic acid export membrane protein